MRAAAWGDFGITADDRWSVLDSDLFEPDGFLTATTQDRDAISGANILDPVGAVTQHGHQVLDTVPISDDYWEGDQLAASPADDLQAGSSSWHETSPEGKARKTVLWFRQPVRPTGAVHPPRVPLKQLADRIHKYRVQSHAGWRKGPMVTRFAQCLQFGRSPRPAMYGAIYPESPFPANKRGHPCPSKWVNSSCHLRPSGLDGRLGRLGGRGDLTTLSRVVAR